MISRMGMKKQCLVLLLLIHALNGSVMAEIVFSNVPKSQAVQYGDNILLHCNASDPLDDTKVLVYQWYFNSVPKPNGGSVFANHSLLIANIKKEHLGDYSCGIREIPKDDNIAVKTILSPVAIIVHAYITGFVTNPKDASATEGDKVTLTCVTGESAPPSEVIWEKDNQHFTGGSQFVNTFGSSRDPGLIRQYSMTLVLDAKPSDRGMYNCMSRNTVLGVAVRSLKVVVEVKPIDKAPYLDPALYKPNVLSPLGRPLMINCPIGGYPVPKYEWNINGKIAMADDSRFILKNGSLLITKLKLNDNGPYKCKGTNKLGTVTSPLTVVGATFLELDFVREPSRKFVVAGHPMTIPCGPPNSYPPVSVSWYHNSKPVVYRSGKQAVFIVDPKNGVWDLFFSEVQKTDEGEYFCVATNNYSLPMTRTSKTGVISVGGAPVFQQPPMNVSVKKGDGVQLACLVTGDPVPNINWLQDGRDLAATNQITFHRNNQEIHITDTNKANEGMYTCKASNSYGIAELSAYVRIMIPAVIIEPAKNMTVVAGTNVKITCKVEGDPTPQVVWYKDGSVLSVGGRILATVDGLVVNSVVIADAGTYICLVKNTVGEASTQMELSITALPFFVKTPVDQIVTITHSFNLTCEVDGNPKPVVNWLYNGTNLFPLGTKISVDKQIVEVQEASWQHVGRYTCVASSIEGAITWTATISMHVPPTVYRIAGNGVVYNSKPLELTCLLNGVPYPSVNWQHNGKQMAASQDGRVTFPQKHRLYIKFSIPADKGNYKCIADNLVGKSESALQVYIIEAPLPPILLIPKAVSSTTVKISWSPATQHPHTPVTHYTLYYKEKLALSYKQHPDVIPSVETSAVMKKLSSGVEYYFLVTASNDAGEGDKSNVKSVKTLDSGPSKPRNLHVTGVTSNAVVLEWEIPSLTNGQIKKYKVWYKMAGQGPKSEEFFTNSSVASPTYTVNSLKAYTVYEFYVQAATIERDDVMWGNLSATVQTRTSVAVPSGSPVNVLAVPLSPYIVHVSWTDVPVSQQHGPTQRFHVLYKPVTSHSVFSEISVKAPADRVNITNLVPWMYFSVSVLAENAAGRGPTSNQIVVRTHQTDPSSAPKNLQLEPIASDTITLQFELPDKSSWNGDLSGYVVQYAKTLSSENIHTKTFYTVQNTHFNITDLEPWTDYNFRVALFNGQGQSLQGPFTNWVKSKTLGSIPGVVRELSIMSTPTSITLNWRAPERPNGVIDSYQVDYYVHGIINQVDNNLQETTTTVNKAGESSGMDKGVSNQNVVKRSADKNQNSADDVITNTKILMTGYGENVPKVTDRFGAEVFGRMPNLLQKKFPNGSLIANFGTLNLVKRDTSENSKSSKLDNDGLPTWVSDKDKEDLTSMCKVSVESNPAVLQLFDSLLRNYTATLVLEGKTEDFLTILRNVLTSVSNMLQNETVLTTDLSSTLQGVARNVQNWIVSNNVSMWSLCYRLYNGTQDNKASPVKIFTVNTTTESAILQNLRPATYYSITLSAVSQYGKGDNLTFITATKSLPPPPPPLPTEPETTSTPTTTVITTTEELAASADSLMDSLPVIVGGCLAGVFLVVMVILLGICLCVRRRPAAMIPKTSDSILAEESREGSIRSQSSVDEPETSRVSAGQATLGNGARYQATASSGSALRDYGPLRESLSIPANISYHPSGITRGSHSASGIYNPAYVSGHVSSYHGNDTESVALSLTLSAEEVYSQASNTLKRDKRMRSESAAAIAVMRTSGIPALGIQTDDTDSLIHNDSVVVYTERTAL